MSIKSNYIYTVTLTLSELVFPLITFPYVTRVLGPTGIGAVNFATSFIGYFILFAALGINIYGQREAAKYRTDKAGLSKAFNQILLIHILSTVLFFLIYSAIILSFDKFRHDILLFATAGVYLLLNAFSIEWFFLGIEQFRYITFRSVITRIIFTLAIFIFIKEKSDYILYYILIAISTSIPFIINIIYAKKVVVFSFRSFYNRKEIAKHLKDLVYSSLYMSITSIYTSFSIVYLGFISTETNVGYFSVANKLFSVVLSFFTALTIVLYPHLSSLMAQNNLKEFKRLIEKSFEIFIPVSIAIVVISILVSNEVVHLFSGDKFKNSVPVLQLFMPLVIVVGLAQIYVSQILFPLKKDKDVLINSAVVAIISIGLNIIIVTRFSLMGAIITLLISETIMTILLGIKVYRYQKIMPSPTLILKNILLSIPYILLFKLIRLMVISDIGTLLAMTFLSFAYFIIIQCFVVKNESINTVAFETLSKLKLQITNKAIYIRNIRKS